MAMYTEQQRAAITTHNKNLVVVAGAGSGKTHVLVERYFTLLEANRDWPLNAIVAITFTREAAMEMRNRIRKKLAERLRQAQQPQDKQHWSDLLAQMDSARIDTIHGLCSTILRANAAEAAVDPNFEVIEPVDAEILLQDVIDSVLHTLMDDDSHNLAALFTEYEARHIREVLADADILSASLQGTADDPDAMLQQWQQDWVENYRQQQAILKADSRFIEDGAWQPPCEWPATDKLYPSWQAVHTYWNALFSQDHVISMGAAQQLVAAINLRGGSKANWCGDKFVVTQAKDALRSIRSRLQVFLDTVGQPPTALDYYAAQMLVRWQRLILRVRAAYQAAKTERGVLDFDDLEAKTARLLQAYPDVRARYQGAEFKCLLVDEFQDTNERQWQIVQHLADIVSDTNLFVVGDMKQSIYGFRGADVRVFGDVRRVIAGLDAGQELPLSRSFRSHPALVAIFNRLFQQIFVRDEASPVREYEIAFDKTLDGMDANRPDLAIDAEAHYAPLELILLRSKQDSLDKAVSADERRLWEAELIAQRLKRLYTDSAPIFNKESNTYEAFQYGDAALLLQSTTQITTYESVFKTMDIPFVTVGGRGYYNRQEVWDVLNLLKALHNPDDDLSLAAALRSPMFRFSDDMLLALRLIRDNNAIVSLWDALSVDEIPHLSDAEHTIVGDAHRTLSHLRQIAGRVTISELLQRALVETAYLAILSGLPGGARLRRNVEKLVNIAEASGKITLGEFSYYLDDLTTREVREGEATLDTAGAVRLMTVHASKGLEFPVVILVDAAWQRRGFSGSLVLYDSAKARLACTIYDDSQNKYVESYPYHQAQRLQSLREAAERKRLLYVAATRARDCLIISGEVSDSPQGWKARGWLGTIIEALSAEEASDGDFIPYTEHGKIKVTLPDYDPNLPRRLRSSDEVIQWDNIRLAGQAEGPPRLTPIHIPQERMLGHIAATQLALIGSARQAADREKAFYRENVRRKILDDTSAQIQQAVPTRQPRVPQRLIGEVVHDALRYWRFPQTDPNTDDVLRSYAWQHGITGPDDVQQVAQVAQQYLKRFQNTPIFHEMQATREARRAFYSELPFILRTQKRILHGMLDVLFQREDETWVVLDYKTSYIPDIGTQSTSKARAHAQRYHLQVGAYATAVKEALGVIPSLYIHYIQYSETVEIPADVWQAAINRLEDYLGDVIGSRYD